MCNIRGDDMKELSIKSSQLEQPVSFYETEEPVTLEIVKHDRIIIEAMWSLHYVSLIYFCPVWTILCFRFLKIHSVEFCQMCSDDRASLKVWRYVKKIDDDYSFFIRLRIEY